MISKLFHFSTGEESSKLAAQRREVEFVLVLVEAGSDQQLEHTIGSVTAAAEGFGGTVLQILGSLILVGFSGVLGAGTQPQRNEFAAQVCSNFRRFVKVLHGRSAALVGTVGCDTRLAYTVIPEHFSTLIGRFKDLAPGQALDVTSPE
jgi:hypothetical protein